jgi:hypothetical protein
MPLLPRNYLEVGVPVCRIWERRQTRDLSGTSRVTDFRQPPHSVTWSPTCDSDHIDNS